MNIALLIIDMQKEFISKDKYKESLTDALEYINETAELFRSKNLPVVVIQDKEAADGPGSEGFENVDELVVKDTDHSIHKFYSNSFWQTELDELLKSLKVEFVVISGFAAEYCVLFTYNGAEERGYGASLLQHGIAGVDITQVKETQLIRPVISLDALDFFISNS